MSFCTFSSQSLITEKTAVDNLFINEFLPSAPDYAVKVYLYGLYKCSQPDSIDNTIESFARVLNMSVDEIEGVFRYWQEQGLVQILSNDLVEVRYLPAKNLFSNIKKYKPEKFSEFNLKIQEIITGRMITPNEFAEYYELIERDHFEPQALLMIAKYCVDLKGQNIGYSYIKTIAKNWSQENIVTAQMVEEKISTLQHIGTNIGELLKVLGIRREPSIEEREVYSKWTKSFELGDDLITFVAKEQKKSKLKVSFEKLDQKLTKYYEMGLTSVKEVSGYENERQNMFKCAYDVNKALGLYYENVETVVENYISQWQQMGFTTTGLVEIAKFCFTKSIRSLQSMNQTIQKLFKLGLVSEQSIFEYIDHLTKSDEQIKEVLNNLGLSRNVTQADRNFYSVWKDTWKISDPLFEYGVSLAKNKIQPVQYLNKLLSSFYENNFKTVEEAKAFVVPAAANYTPKDRPKGRSYSQSQLNALFDSIDEIEV